MDTHNITHVLQFLSCNLQHRNYTDLSKECMHTVRVGLPPLIMVMATIPACSYSHWGLLLQPLLDRAGICISSNFSCLFGKETKEKEKERTMYPICNVGSHSKGWKKPSP